MNRVSLNRRRAVLGAAAFVALGWRSGAAQSAEPDWRDFEREGMTGRRSYESPQHGVSITWSREWELDASVDPPVTTADDSDAFHTDTLSLVHDPDGNVAYFQLSCMDRGSTTVADQMDWTVSDEGLAYFFGDPDGGTVLASGSARRAGQVWLQYADSGAVIAVTAIQKGATLMNCVMACLPENAEEAWTASANVLVDEADVFQIVDWAEIESAIASQKTSGTGTTTGSKAGSEDDIDPAYAEAGLTSPTSYESPQYGYVVEWTDPWSMRPPTDTWGAVVSTPKSGTDRLVLDYAKPGSTEFLATLLIDSSPSNDLTPEIIVSSDDYPEHSTYATDVVTLTLIDSKKGRQGSALAVWEVRYTQGTRDQLMGYQLIAIDTVGDGVQRQTRLDLHRDSSEAAEDDFATLTSAITMDGDAILLGYSPEEFSDAIADA